MPRRPPASRPVATIVFIVLYCTLYIINVYVGTLQFCTIRVGPRRAARGATHIIPHIRDLCTESTPRKENVQVNDLQISLTKQLPNIRLNHNQEIIKKITI